MKFEGKKYKLRRFGGERYLYCATAQDKWIKLPRDVSRKTKQLWKLLRLRAAKRELAQ